MLVELRGGFRGFVIRVDICLAFVVLFRKAAIFCEKQTYRLGEMDKSVPSGGLNLIVFHVCFRC